MDALTKLVGEILHLGGGFVVPMLALVIVAIIRLFPLNRALAGEPPVADVAYELELGRRLLGDKWVIGISSIDVLWILAYHLAIYPPKYVTSVLIRICLLYAVPYLLPIAVIISIIWLSRGRTWARRAIIVAISVSPLWIFAYWRWIYPVRPTPSQKMGMWVTSLTGQQNDRRYLKFFEGLKKHAWHSPIYVDEFRETLHRTSLDNQIDQARELISKVAATGMLWLEVGDKEEYLYASIPHDKTDNTWDMPPSILLSLSSLKEDSTGLVEFLSGLGYSERNQYDLAINEFESVEKTHSTPLGALLLAYAYLQRGRRGNQTSLSYTIQYLNKTGLQDSNDDEIRGQAHFLLGRAYSEVMFSVRQDDLHSRGEAFGASERAFESALRDFSSEKFLTERNRVVLGLSEILTDPDPLLDDIVEHSQRAQSLLEQAVQSFKGRDTQIEYGLAKFWLGVAYANQALHNEDASEELSKRAIQNYEEALAVFGKNKFPAKYALLKDDIGSVYRNLSSSNPETYSARGLDVYREARSACQEFDLQQTAANEGICVLAVYSANSNVLQEGETACEQVIRDLRRTNSLELIRTYLGLGDLYRKMDEILTETPLPGVDPLKYLRMARTTYLEGLRIADDLPQKPYVFKVERILRGRIGDVEAAFRH